MRCKKLCMVIILLILFLNTGCSSQVDIQPKPYRVVTQIDVVYHKHPIVSDGSFTNPEKMQKIMYYLRRISPYGKPLDDPEQIQGSDFYITLRYSDNTQKVYQQRDDRFMRVNGGPWKRIDPKRAMMLSRILGTLESDTKPTTKVPFFPQSL